MIELDVKYYLDGDIGFTLVDTTQECVWAHVLLTNDSILELVAAVRIMAESSTTKNFLTICDIVGEEDFLELIGFGEYVTMRITSQSFFDNTELEMQVSLPALLEYISSAIDCYLEED
tara:strand:+ start:5211 stop:5564 length:354 start_codon:yes stop_codon:yes gene_type:complete